MIFVDRAILHCDMNNFFASVELLDMPNLRLFPVAVCGDAEMRHGIVLAKNDIAKAFGIKTGETIGSAKKKCPSLKIVSPHYDKYKEYSERAKKIYYSYTNLCEEYSIDECFLDVTSSNRLFGSGEDIARQISERVKNELGLTVSIGVSYNKFFAKMGSDYKKPDAITCITRDNYKKILWTMPIEQMLFVGASCAEQLKRIGIFKIGDLANAPSELLINILGKNGAHLKALASGFDDEPVLDLNHSRVPKSISCGVTPSRNLCSGDDVKNVLLSLAQNVSKRLKEQELKCQEISLKVRDPSFFEISHQVKLVAPTQLWHEIFSAAYGIYLSSFSHIKEIRALSLRTAALKSVEGEAIPFCFEETENLHFEAIEDALDNIRSRFGDESIQNGIQYTCDDLKF